MDATFIIFLLPLTPVQKPTGGYRVTRPEAGRLESLAAKMLESGKVRGL
jgi:hypothetical protein